MNNHKINTLREYHEASEQLQDREASGNQFPWLFVVLLSSFAALLVALILLSV